MDIIKKIFKKKLDNGLTVLVYPRHSIPKVSTQLWYNVGSKDEKTGEKGLAHLLEHMIFKGTKRLSESDINLITTKLSGSCNAFTSYDYTGYLFDFPTQNWKHSIEILADCMTNCTFKEELLNSELKAVIQELKMYRDYYSSGLMEELVSTIYSDHPYHHPIIGYKQDLWNITRESLLEFYHKHYTPNNATLVVVGDVEPNEVFNTANEYFGHINPSPYHKKDEFYHSSDLINRSVTLYRDVAQPLVIMAYPMFGSQAKQDYVSDILSWIIGTGKGSRLYRKLVDQLQLTTDLESFTYDLFQHGLFCIYFTPKNQVDINQIINIISQELVILGHSEVSHDELIRATKKAQMAYITQLENNEHLAGIIGKTYLATGDENYLFKYLDVPIDSLAPSIYEIARTYLRPTLANSASVLPLPEGEQDYWSLLQHKSDEEDNIILKRKIRESEVEKGVEVHDIIPEVPKPFDFPKAKKHSLSNGLELLYYHNVGVGKIELVMEFKANQQYDEDKLGLSGFVAEMLSEGTQQYPREKFVDILEINGMTFTATPGIITMSMLSSDLKLGLEIVHQAVTSALFDQENLEKVRAKITADIQNYWDNPSQFADQVAREYVYKNHPMSKGILGTIDGISAITREDILNYYKSFYSPDKTKVSIVGDIKKYNIEQIFEDIFSQWSGPKVKELIYPKLNKTKAEQVDFPINRDQIVLCFAGLSVKRNDKDFDKLLIFDQIFTGGYLGSMSSRLFQLREASGLFYTIGGSLLAHAGEEPSMVFIKTVVSKDRLLEAQKAIAEVIDHAPNNITDQEFKEAQNSIINSLVDFFETSRQIAITFLFLARFNLPDDFFNARANQIMAITKQEVKTAAKSILSTKSLVLIRVGRVDGV